MPRLKKREHSVGDVELGRYLPWKAHRLRGLITLEAIADETKISRRFLDAIEGGAYGELPGGLFTTSYIRQYAAMIGFDCGAILLHRDGGERSEAAEGEADRGRAAGSRWGRGLLESLAEKV